MRIGSLRLSRIGLIGNDKNYDKPFRFGAVESSPPHATQLAVMAMIKLWMGTPCIVEHGEGEHSFPLINIHKKQALALIKGHF